MNKLTKEHVGVLQTAKSIVADGWVQKAFACDKDNRSVAALDPSACEFCSAGALIKALGSEGLESGLYETCLYALTVQINLGKERRFDSQGVVPWNDAYGRTKQEVVALFQATIDSIKKELANEQS